MPFQDEICVWLLLYLWSINFIIFLCIFENIRFLLYRLLPEYRTCMLVEKKAGKIPTWTPLYFLKGKLDFLPVYCMYLCIYFVFIRSSLYDIFYHYVKVYFIHIYFTYILYVQWTFTIIIYNLAFTIYILNPLIHTKLIIIDS